MTASNNFARQHLYIIWKCLQKGPKSSHLRYRVDAYGATLAGIRITDWTWSVWKGIAFLDVARSWLTRPDVGWARGLMTQRGRNSAWVRTTGRAATVVPFSVALVLEDYIITTMLHQNDVTRIVDEIFSFLNYSVIKCATRVCKNLRHHLLTNSRVWKILWGRNVAHLPNWNQLCTGSTKGNFHRIPVQNRRDFNKHPSPCPTSFSFFFQKK